MVCESSIKIGLKKISLLNFNLKQYMSKPKTVPLLTYTIINPDIPQMRGKSPQCDSVIRLMSPQCD